MAESERERYPKAEFVDQILGKTITGVVIKRSMRDNPRTQLHLVFADGTHFEFYCQHDDIVPIKGLRRGGIEAINRYSVEDIVYENTLKDGRE